MKLDGATNFRLTYHESVDLGGVIDLHRIARVEVLPVTGIRVLRLIEPFGNVVLVEGEQLSRVKTERLREAVEFFRQVGVL